MSIGLFHLLILFLSKLYSVEPVLWKSRMNVTTVD